MKNNTLDADITDKELIAYVLAQLYEASDCSERVLKILDEMIANIKDVDTTKPRSL